MSKFLLVALAALLLVPATATANPRAVEVALIAGAADFGPTKCGAGFRPRVLLTDIVWPGVIGYADTEQCAVLVDPYELEAEGINRPEYVCTVAVHEYGHLAGRGHATDPNNVMYPYLSEYTFGVYPWCRSAAEVPVPLRLKPL